MSLIEAIVLGIFQGISEFLPISSSGHLVLLQRLFGIEEGNLFFSVMLHFGTLLSVFIVYFNDIINIIKEFIKLVADTVKYKKIVLNNEYRILAMMIIIGTIPTGLMGIFLNDFFEGLYASVIAVGISLMVTGLILWIAEKKASGRKSVREMGTLDAIMIGFFQGLAIIPGISRSGSTIVGALFRGFNKKLATRFSFLLSMPAIFGASFLEFYKSITDYGNIYISKTLVIGVLLATVSGVFAIKLLIRLLEKGRLHYFSYYVWFVGLLTIVLRITNVI